MGAFELGSRLPPPPGAATTSAGQLRFSLEQMLEVLEAALLQPRHGLASEGQLLRWQLRRMLDFGQPRDAQAAPPLACPPPSPSAPLDEPRVRVVGSLSAAELRRTHDTLRSMRDATERQQYLSKATGVLLVLYFFVQMCRRPAAPAPARARAVHTRPRADDAEDDKTA